MTEIHPLVWVAIGLAIIGMALPPLANVGISKVQKGVVSVTVNSGTDTGTATVTFNPAFQTVPIILVSLRPSTVTQLIVTKTYPILSSEGLATTWIVPSATTEFLGTTRAEKKYNILPRTNLGLRFCVNTAPGFGTVTLENSPDAVTWNSMTWTAMNIQFGGIQCSIFFFDAVNVSGDVFYRVMGSAGDDVTPTDFYAMWFEVQSSFREISVEAFNPTVNGFTMGVRTGFSLSSSQTFSTNWMAGV